MLFNFATVGIFLALAFLFVFAALITSRLIQPYNPYPEKQTTYECGEPPIGSAWVRFNNRFYIIALIFLIFDVEVIFILPCAVIFKEWIKIGLGPLMIIEILLFIAVLLVGLGYVWAKGDLVWIKTSRRVFGEEEEVAAPQAAGEETKP